MNMIVPVRRGSLNARTVARSMFMVAVVVIVAMRMIVRMRMSRILLRPIFFPRHILLAVDPNIHFRRRDSTTNHAGNLQLRTHREGRHRVFQQLRTHSGIDESAEEHISADTGKTL